MYLKILNKKIKKGVEEWSCNELIFWLWWKKSPFEILDLIKKKEINGKKFLSMDTNEINQLQISSHRKQTKTFFIRLKKNPPFFSGIFHFYFFYFQFFTFFFLFFFLFLFFLMFFFNFFFIFFFKFFFIN